MDVLTTLTPSATPLGIEVRVSQPIHGKTEISCQATLYSSPISQLFIFLKKKNGTRQMFIQVVDQPGCFVLSLAIMTIPLLVSTRGRAGTRRKKKRVSEKSIVSQGPKQA